MMSPGGHVTSLTAPYRITPPVVRDALAGLCGTENCPVVYARPIFASEPHAELVAAADDTPSSKRNLSSKIFAKSAATYFLPLT